jgi:hypothetical protein
MSVIDQTNGDPLSYLLRVQGDVQGETRRGTVTSWRRVRGNRWEVRYLDLGQWSVGDDDDLLERFKHEERAAGGRHPDPTVLARWRTRRHGHGG